MVDQFYVERGAKKAGPFSTAQLKGLAASGRLQPTDAIWKEGMDKPVLAAKVKNLFPAPPEAPNEIPNPDSANGGASRNPVDETKEAPALQVDETPPPSVDAGQAAADEIDALQLPPPGENAADEQPALTKEEEPKEKKTPRQAHKERKRRAVATKGAIITSQDGVYVSFRKKCTDCGHEDAARTTTIIGHGIIRAYFFCPKCRKNREVILQGMQM